MNFFSESTTNRQLINNAQTSGVERFIDFVDEGFVGGADFATGKDRHQKSLVFSGDSTGFKDSRHSLFDGRHRRIEEVTPDDDLNGDTVRFVTLSACPNS